MEKECIGMEVGEMEKGCREMEMVEMGKENRGMGEMAMMVGIWGWRVWERGCRCEGETWDGVIGCECAWKNICLCLWWESDEHLVVFSSPTMR